MRKFMLVAALVLFACAVLVLGTSLARVLARDNGQWQNVDPQVRQWFREQKSPKTGGYCCNESDGTYAEEDIRDGHYWTRFEQSDGKWIPVPMKSLSATLIAMALPSRGGSTKTAPSKSAAMPQEEKCNGHYQRSRHASYLLRLLWPALQAEGEPSVCVALDLGQTLLLGVLRW
jgi:hypothetical protein